jgi:hypothetical protein
LIDETGQWVRRPPSTTYKSRGTISIPTDGSTPFIDGDLAIHVGDLTADPAITSDGSTAILTSSAEGVTARVPYYNHFYRGKVAGDNELSIYGNLSGAVISGTINSVTTARNWWTDYINGHVTQTTTGTITGITTTTTGSDVTTLATIAATVPTLATSCNYTVTDAGSGATVLAGSSPVSTGTVAVVQGNFTSTMVGDATTLTFIGPLHVETGTITGCTATSISDSAHITTGTTNPEQFWWNAGRFIGFSDSSAYTDFILQIAHIDGDTTTTYKFPITSTTNGDGGVTINFATTTATITPGDLWTIVEPPYEINKHEGRKLYLIDPDFNKYVTTITHSDNDSLWFGTVTNTATSTTTTISPGTGWSFSIDQHRFGTVWKWDADAGEWIKPTGMDTARLGVPTPTTFPENQTMILATHVKDYGLAMVDDVWTDDIPKEMYATINKLTASTGPVSWTNKSCETCDPVNNYGVSSAEDYSPPTFAASLEEAQGSFSWSSMLDGTAPYSEGGAYYDGAYMVDLLGVFAWERVTNYSQIFPATIDFYALSPKIADFCFCSLEITGCPDDPTTGEPPPIVPPDCNNCGGYDGESPCVLVDGESDWTGSDVAGLNYGTWTLLSSADNSQLTAYSRSVGDQAPQRVIDPIALLGYARLTPGLGAGYTISNQLAVFHWQFTYVGT